MKINPGMLITVASPKVKMINVRLAPSVHDAFKIACDLRGASMSSLLHQYIVRTIREEKEHSPRAFATRPVQGIAIDKSRGVRAATIHVAPVEKLRKTG